MLLSIILTYVDFVVQNPYNFVMSIVHQSDFKISTSKPITLDWHCILGTVSKISSGLFDELHVTATEIVDCDIARLPRTTAGDYVIRGCAQTLRRHGAFEVGALVKILVRSAWSHVSINDGKPIVWIEPK